VRVGGGLYYVTGPMGSGKSLFGVRRGVDALFSGRYWVTNQALYPDAFERMARHVCRSPWAKEKRSRLAKAFESYYVYETDINEARRYRTPGDTEARALFTWDESHNDLSNRTYKDRDQGILEWATQLRKLGFEGYLLSQHHMNTDAQLRRISNGVVMLENQREQHRIMGIRLKFLPPLFLAHWFPAHALGGVNGQGKTKSWRVERYLLSWHRKLYDTLDLYHGVASDDDDGNAIRLPIGGWHRSASALVPAAGPTQPPLALEDVETNASTSPGALALGVVAGGPAEGRRDDTDAASQPRTTPRRGATADTDTDRTRGRAASPPG
jgi:Zonular occludens toxin (Zot)